VQHRVECRRGFRLKEKSASPIATISRALEHRAVVERIRNIKEQTPRIDPGTVAGVSAPATYVLGDLQILEFGIRPVPV
jgi:hypothetical protein